MSCPPKCGGIGTQIDGTNIHPFTTPICVAAVVDRAVSLYGGIVRVTIAPGLEKYEKGISQMLNSKINKQGKSKLSF